MKIALIGHGNMGKEIESLVKAASTHVICGVTGGHADALDEACIKNADVAIEFTSASTVVDNIRAIAQMGTPIVVGTTGWSEHMDEVKRIVDKSDIGLIYGDNFSIGANIFFQVVGFASRLASAFPGYDVLGYEIHHKGKADSPSGTAKRTARAILENFPSKKTMQGEMLSRKVREDELHFASVRGGINRGLHTVVFDSEADEISLTHRAHGRRGFAAGAVMAAEFIKDKKGVYSFDDLFNDLIK